MFDPQTIMDFPRAPGVYIMKDAQGTVLYVGKAINLRNRVRSYFTAAGDGRYRIRFLVKIVETIETIVTATEKDAFLLENNLIKKYRPRFNIQLRDDKTYISLRFRMNHKFPRLETVRVRRADLSGVAMQALGTGEPLIDTAPVEETGRKRGKVPDRYFGPFTSSGAVRETLRFLLKIFPVRTCRDSVFRNRTRPCLLYDVGKCCGPCTEPVSEEYYQDLIRRVSVFFSGRDEEVRRTLEDRMLELAENMEFEKAALIRDRIAALEATLEAPQTESHIGADRDVVAVASAQGRSLVVVQQFRRGILLHSTEFYTKNYEMENGEVLYSFLSQHYDGLGKQIPAEILVAEEPDDRALLEDWMKDERGGAVRLHVPQRGKLNAIIHTAQQNARLGLNRRLGGERTREETLEELQERLNLNKLPNTIECLDISNIMGVLAVGSIVRFENGEADKSGYRLYRIRTVEGSNDFAMIREVMMRRFRPDSGRAREFPDLFIVDGGKGQLGVAEEVFKELGIMEVSLAGMAKSRLKVREPRRASGKASFQGYGSEDKIRFRTEERLFLPGRKNPVTFAPNSPALHLLERIRNETHRTAITYHRKLRQKTNRRSMLDEVPGVGPKRKVLLLRKFGSLTALKAASLEELAAVDGVSLEAAKNVYEFLRAEHQPLEKNVMLVEEDDSVMLDDETEAEAGEMEIEGLAKEED